MNYNRTTTIAKGPRASKQNKFCGLDEWYHTCQV